MVMELHHQRGDSNVRCCHALNQAFSLFAHFGLSRFAQDELMYSIFSFWRKISHSVSNDDCKSASQVKLQKESKLKYRLLVKWSSSPATMDGDFEILETWRYCKQYISFHFFTNTIALGSILTQFRETFPPQEVLLAYLSMAQGFLQL